MPLPFILGGLGLLAGAIGIEGHIEAKDTNERARITCRNAELLYENAKSSLEHHQRKAEASLVKLGELKSNVLENSIKPFIEVYNHIKKLRLDDSYDLGELSRFVLDDQDALQLQEMSNTYLCAIRSGVAAAATGALVSLAANGTLTTAASASGAFLASGSVLASGAGAGTGLAAISAGLSPLAAIAVPIVFFSGLSSSIKADENLEKARKMEAEAEVAAEKMKVSETLCIAITKRSEMFSDLLEELNKMLSICSVTLNYVIRKRGYGKNSLTKEEKELAAVSRAVAGAVKRVLDTPILKEEGRIYVAMEINELSDNRDDFKKRTSDAIMKLQGSYPD